jgi:hypothetical protein
MLRVADSEFLSGAGGAIEQAEAREESSFLKKRSKRLLLLRKRKVSGHGRPALKRRRHDRLLVLLFRKEPAF